MNDPPACSCPKAEALTDCLAVRDAASGSAEEAAAAAAQGGRRQVEVTSCVPAGSTNPSGGGTVGAAKVGSLGGSVISVSNSGKSELKSTNTHTGTRTRISTKVTIKHVGTQLL